MKLPGRGLGLELVFGRPTLALDSAMDHQIKHKKNKTKKHKQKAKRAAGIEGQVATMLDE